MGFSLVLMYGKIALNHLSTKGLPEPGYKDPRAGQALGSSVSGCQFRADTLGRGFSSTKLYLGAPPSSVVAGSLPELGGRDRAGRWAGSLTLALSGWALAAPVHVYDTGPLACIRRPRWAQGGTGATRRPLLAPNTPADAHGRRSVRGPGRELASPWAQPLHSTQLCSASLWDPLLKGPAWLPGKRSAWRG